MRLPQSVQGLTLDTGALIGIERRSARVAALLVAAGRRDWPIVVPVGAVGQAWRGGARQALLARFLSTPQVTIVPMDEHTGFAAGVLCGRSGHSDVIDASVVLCAIRRGHAVVTSDPEDLIRLDPTVPLLAI